MGSENETTVYNPGSIDLREQNPAVYEEIAGLEKLRNDFRDSKYNFLDEGKYQRRTIDAMDRAQANTLNRYASLGLGGSSAAMGAAAESDRQVQFAYDDKRLNDYLKSLQVESSLSGQISGNKLAIQNQFQNYQSMMVQQKQHEIDQQNQMVKGIIGGAAAVGGALLAPATGGLSLAAGFGINSAMGGGGDGGAAYAGYQMSQAQPFNYGSYYGQDMGLSSGGGGPSAGQGLDFYGQGGGYGYGR